MRSQLSAGAAMLHVLDYIGNTSDLLLHAFTNEWQGMLPKFQYFWLLAIFTLIVLKIWKQAYNEDQSLLCAVQDLKTLLCGYQIEFLTI